MSLESIKEKIDTKKAQRERLIGEKETHERELKELGYNTITKAKNAVKKLETEIQKDFEEYKKQVEIFEQEYKELLE